MKQNSVFYILIIASLSNGLYAVNPLKGLAAYILTTNNNVWDRHRLQGDFSPYATIHVEHTQSDGLFAHTTHSCTISGHHNDCLDLLKNNSAHITCASILPGSRATPALAITIESNPTCTKKIGTKRLPTSTTDLTIHCQGSYRSNTYRFSQLTEVAEMPTENLCTLQEL